MPVFNYIIGIYSGLLWAGWDTYATSGTDPLDHSIFYVNAVNWTCEFAYTTGIAFSPVYHVSSVFVAEDCTVGAGFHAGTTGYATECFAINQANCPCRAFLDAFSNAFAFIGC